MLLVGKVKKDKLVDTFDKMNNAKGLDKLEIIRSQIPAVTHVDYSARVQTVDKKTNEKFYKLINKFNEKRLIPQKLMN